MSHSDATSSASTAPRRLCSHAAASAAAAASRAAASNNRYPPGNFFSANSRRSVSSSLSVAAALDESMPPIHSNTASWAVLNERTRSASSDRTSARSNPGGAASGLPALVGVDGIPPFCRPSVPSLANSPDCADASASSKTHHSRLYAGGVDHDDGAMTTRWLHRASDVFVAASTVVLKNFSAVRSSSMLKTPPSPPPSGPSSGIDGKARVSGRSSLCGGTFWFTLNTSMKKLVSRGFNRLVSTNRSSASTSWSQFLCQPWIT